MSYALSHLKHMSAQQPKAGAKQGRRPPPMVTVSREGRVPLSFAQQRLWFLEQLAPGGYAYNVPLAATLRGPLDVAALAWALSEVLRRHEALRTTFALVDGQPVQRISPASELPLPVESLEAVPGSERAREARRLVEEEARRPFELEKGPLFRARLLRLAAGEHVLLLSLHHVVCDGWSMGVLERELSALYRAHTLGETSPLPVLPVQYADYAAWQREWLQGEVLDAQLAWWKQQLAGAPPVLELPTDRPRPAVQTSRGAVLRVEFPSALSSAVKGVSRREGVTPFMTLLAAFQALLARYSGQTDVVVGSPISGRVRREVEGLVGFFANTLALRVDASGDPSFRELLGRVRGACLGAYAHQDIPFEQIVDALQPVRDLSRTPLFQASFVLLGAEPFAALELPGVHVEELVFEPGVARFDLTLFVRETPTGWVGLWEYNTGLFDEATVARMAAHYARLLEGALARPEQPVSALPLLSEEEHGRLLREWNRTEADFPRDACVHSLFEAQARRTPEALAVRFQEQSLTFGELARRSHQLAHHLRRLGVGPGTFVGLCLERSLEMVVAVLGVLEAGGAYVPLDPTHPRQRLAFMLEDSRVPVLLTQRHLAAALPVSGQRLLCLDSDWAHTAGLEPGHAPSALATAEDLAYLIYTSGSTGRPKGVMVEHRGVVNYLHWCTQAYAIAEGQGAPVHSSLSFDLTVTSLLAPLMVGRPVVLVPESEGVEGLAKALLEGADFSLVKLTPSHLRLLEQQLPAGKAAGRTRSFIIGGEALTADMLAFWRSHAPGTRLVNEYGPTETVVGCCVHTVEEFEASVGAVSIGRPIANTRLHVLDTHLRPAPVGVLGELYIGGAGVARGYWARPELTAERFIPDPFGSEPGARLYRTGDRVRYLPDGRLEFLGRVDHQVKVRGYRIELGELEAAMTQHPSVRECVVVTRDEGPAGTRLVAYVAPTSPGLTSVELRAFLEERLPPYMVPSAFVVLEALPLTPNGKVDRDALPEPEREEARAEYEPPRTELERLVADLWAPLLGLSRVGAHGHFFELGGHSLLATRVVSRLREVLRVEVPVRVLFEAPTVAELAARLESLRGGPPERQVPPLVRVAREGALPLSFAQQRLWFLEQLSPGGYAYNVPFFVRLTGRLDLAALERSLAELVRRHEALRTTFAEVDGQPVQRIVPEWVLAVPVEALEGGALEQRARDEVQRPFDLKQGPLVRAKLLRLAPDEHVLLLVLHHIVCDGWSMGVLVRELEALYPAFARGETPEPTPLPVQYADYAAWQRAWLKGEALEGPLSWWKQRLAGAPPVLELPTDRPRPPVQSFRGALLKVELPPALSGALRALNRREGVTPFMTFLAAYVALLSRYSGQTELVVGSPIAGRTRRELEGLIGFFVNTLVLRVEAPGNESFRELLGRVREACLEAYAHQDVPFEQLVEALRPERDMARTPLFQVMFALQDALPVLELPGLSLAPLDVDPGMAKFDLTLFVRESPEGWTGFWEYNADLFDEATVARMAAHYARLLEGALARPEQRLATLPLLSEAERHQLLVEWNGSARAYAKTGTLHGHFEAQVARTPDAVAVCFESARLTYRELNARANQLAHHLRGLGVGPEVLVGVCLERSLEMVVALLGVLKAGGAYVPLDPAYPQERLAFMLEDSQVPVLVTQRSLEAGLPAHGATRVRLDEDAAVIGSRPESNPESGAEAGNLAYVIYTSGSTGRPKGSEICHAQVNRLFSATEAWFGFGERDVWTLFHSYAFDFSVWELWGALRYGGRLVVVPYLVSRSPEAFRELLRLEGVTVLNQTPSAFQQLVQVEVEGRALEPLSLRYVIFGGEALEFGALRPWFDRYGDETPRLVNMYGITETTVHVTYRPVRKEEARGGSASVVGVAIPDLRTYVLDRHGGLAPVGVPGELFVGGEGLGRGYHGRPELTAERFIPDGLSGTSGSRLYRTGDLGRWRADGELEYLGRIDNQVKVRGFRIELGELEAALGRHESVRQSVVVVREVAPGDKRLVAYVVPTTPRPPGEGRGEGSASPEPTPAELRAWLKQLLPEYMVPAAFVVLEALPLTTNGKVDRKALPVPREQQEGRAYVAPRTAMEELVAGLWAPLLGRERVGVDENFFELGGHSLLATRVVSRLREVLHAELPVRVLFEAPTVEELARRLEEPRSAPRASRLPPLVPMPRDGALPLSFAQQRLWFLDRLEPDSPLYNVYLGLELSGPLDMAVLGRSFHELVRRHESLRTTFRQGEREALQVISPPVELPLAVVDLRELPEGAREEEARRLAGEEARRPFELTAGPLLRVTLLRLTETEHVLVLVVHHIVSDGWSLEVLVGELKALYEAFLPGKESPLAEPPLQYADYARWQREWLRGEVLESQVSWWREQLRGAPPALELPTDRPRPPRLSYRGAVERVHLPVALTGQLRKVSQREGVTLFMTLLAGFQALLHRYSGQEDVSVGSPIAGRGHTGLEGLIGFFVNMLVMRARVRGDEPFRELLHRVRETALGAYAHQDVPFEMLVDELKPARDLSRAPLFQVAFALQNSATPELALPGVKSRPMDLHSGTAKSELLLALAETREGLEGAIEYNTDLFDASTIVRLAGHLRTLLEGVAADPGQRIHALPLMGEAERARVLVEWNGRRADYARDTCAHHLIEAQAELTPDAVAVAFEDSQLTYRELDRRANQLAHHLRGLGVGPETRVGLCLERSLEMVVALLGVLKAGGAYVPLDAAYPRERLAFMMEEARMPVLVSSRALADGLPSRGEARVLLDEAAEALAGQPEHAPVTGVGADNLAYVIFTSGSTGRPKGALLTHRGLCNLALATVDTRAMGPDCRVLQYGALSFDISVIDLFPTLVAGGCVVVAPRESLLPGAPLDALLKQQRVTSWTMTPSVLMQQAGGDYPALGTIISGGEPCTPELVKKWKPGRRFFNEYGPTEVTVCATSNASVDASRPTLGRPLPNVEVYVLDRWLQPVPVGVTGELYVGGPGVARGYLDRPELTAERFLPHPFSAEPGARLYRTGDLGRWLEGGELEYLGRSDTQVKVRGFRIELGEVEGALAKHPAVKESTVVVREDVPGDKRLVAYAVPHTAPLRLHTADLRAFLKQHLPEHMVPSAFVVLEHLPLSPTGKVDRQALPPPDTHRPELGDAYVAPEVGLEQGLSALWAEVLRLDRIGAGDNFFDLGGNSLLLQTVHVKVQELVGRRVPLVELFQYPTVRALAVHLARGEGAATVGEGSGQGSGNRRDGQRRLVQQRRGRPGTN